MPEAEETFFTALQGLVGPAYLVGKSSGRRVSPQEVFLDSDYTLYGLPAAVQDTVRQTLEGLMSTGRIPAGSLSHHIDGLLLDHPKFGTRIVEFDEEQHFNTFRRVTLEGLAAIYEAPYIRRYVAYCLDIRFFNAMLKKHRLAIRIDFVPTNVLDFQHLVEANVKPENGYIKPKAGFDFWGGRIAQRAYYDLLRDIAHLGEKNAGLKPAVRFSRYDFEVETGRPFEKIATPQLMGLIQAGLQQVN